MLIQELLNISEAMAKNSDEEGQRQKAIKDVLRKLNNGVISKKSADKQLKDKGHPGIDLNEDIGSDVRVKQIGKKHKVDFEDADGKAAFNAIKDAYKQGYD